MATLTSGVKNDFLHLFALMLFGLSSINLNDIAIAQRRRSDLMRVLLKDADWNQVMEQFDLIQ
jgi:hypothetical protein